MITQDELKDRLICNPSKVQFKGKTYGAGYHINLKDAKAAISFKRDELHGNFANQS